MCLLLVVEFIEELKIEGMNIIFFHTFWYRYRRAMKFYIICDMLCILVCMSEMCCTRNHLVIIKLCMPESVYNDIHNTYICEAYRKSLRSYNKSHVIIYIYSGEALLKLRTTNSIQMIVHSELVLLDTKPLKSAVIFLL